MFVSYSAGACPPPPQLPDSRWGSEGSPLWEEKCLRSGLAGGARAPAAAATAGSVCGEAGPGQWTVSLTCHWQRSTLTIAHLWTSSTLVSRSPGPGSCHWTRWSHPTQRPASRWTGRRSTPPACPALVGRAWTPGFSPSLISAEFLDLQEQSGQNFGSKYIHNTEGNLHTMWAFMRGTGFMPSFH